MTNLLLGPVLLCLICIVTGKPYDGLPGGPCKVDHWFPNQSYVMTVNDVVWLRSAPIRFRVNGKEYSSADGGLEKISDKGMAGTDKLGDYMIYTWTYKVQDLYITINFKPYLNKNYLILQQHYVNKTSGTSAGDIDGVISHFPAFNVDDTRGGDMGVLAPAHLFSGDSRMTIGRWVPGNISISTGVGGGPIAFFDKKDTVIISPFSEFTASNTFFDSKADSISWGLKGGIEEVPENFLQQYIVMYSPDGINAAFREWGDVMRSYYNRPSSYRESDLTNNYLGYWTDHGAYYYYHPADQQNYEETVYGAIDYANKLSIPYRYFQYDEWFYNTDQHVGTLTWDALPGVFPDGLRYVYNKTQWPVSAHNKWWSTNTTYAKQNGGQFDFVLDDDVGYGIPTEEEFWNSLFREAKTWGLIVYEQDFLGDISQKMKSLNTDVYLTKNWLTQMGNAAQKNGITLQYCMAYPLHILAALEIPTVTQARVSGDGVPGNNKGWQIGISSIFPQAMGLAPYKDNFWTTAYQPGNPYGANETEPFLQLTVSVLTTGPVGPGDGIGFTDVDLLMRCCNNEGLILKPDLPALAIDNQIRQKAFADGSGPMGEVYVTKSVINGLEFGIIFAADMKETYQLRPSETGLNVTSGMVMPTVFFNASTPIVKFTEDNPLSLTTECATFQFCLYYTSPVFTVGNLAVMIYGEVGKVTPMSNSRVKGIGATSDGDIRIRITGGGNESVIFRFWHDNQKVDVTCVIGITSMATISLLNRNCEPF